MGSGKSRVPAGRIERLFRMGTMAADVAAGTAVETARTWWTGEAKSNGWNEVLDRASKQPGANVRKNRYYG